MPDPRTNTRIRYPARECSRAVIAPRAPTTDLEPASHQIGILLLIFPILKAVAIHTLSTSVLSVSASNITNASNGSFALTLEGQVRKVGVFPARLIFQENVTVHWIAPEKLDEELQLGHFELAEIGVAAGHGRIKQLTTFVIDDQPGFARFTECELLLLKWCTIPNMLMELLDCLQT